MSIIQDKTSAPYLFNLSIIELAEELISKQEAGYKPSMANEDTKISIHSHKIVSDNQQNLIYHHDHDCLDIVTITYIFCFEYLYSPTNSLFSTWIRKDYGLRLIQENECVLIDYINAYKTENIIQPSFSDIKEIRNMLINEIPKYEEVPF